MESNSGYITISQGSVPGGYGIITVSGAGSTTTIKQGQITCLDLIVDTNEWSVSPYNGRVGYILDRIWNHSSWGLETLRDRIDELEDRISYLE